MDKQKSMERIVCYVVSDICTSIQELAAGLQNIHFEKEREKMEKILKIAELLGEENAQKIKDEISEILLDYLKSDLDNMCDYIIDYEELFEDVRKEVFANVRYKMVKKYTAEIEKRFDELLAN